MGRKRELATIAAALADLAGAAGGVVLVHGAAGLGKTRLVREALAGADQRLEVLWGSAYLLDRDLAYGPVVEALTRHLDSIGPGDRADLLAGVDVLGSLLDGYGLVVPAQSEPAVERLRRAEAIRRVINRISSRRPVALVIDDAHWADDQSLEVLQRLVRDIDDSPLLLLLTYRATEARPHLRELLGSVRRRDALREVALDPLEQSEAEELATAWLADASETDVNALARRAAGNPLFLGALARDVGVGAGAGGAHTGLAAEMLLARTGDLGDEARDVLDHLAVAGIPVTPQAVAGLAGIGEGAFDDAFVALVDGGLVSAPDERGLVSIAHPLIAEAAYDAVPPLRRTRLHAEHARALELQPGTDLGHLARHVRSALGVMDPAQALDILARAGEQALSRAGGREAVQNLTAALDVARAIAPGRLGRLLELLAAAWMNEHEPLAGSTVLREALDAYVRQGDVAGEARCRVMRAADAWYREDPDTARRELDAALELTKQTDDAVTHAALIARQAHLAHSVADPQLLTSAAEALQELADRTGNPSATTAAAVVGAWRAQLDGDLVGVVESATVALAQPDRSGAIDPSLWALDHRARVIRAQAYAALGLSAQALEDAEPAYAFAHDVGAPVVAWRSQAAAFAVAMHARPAAELEQALDGLRWAFRDGDRATPKVLAFVSAWVAVGREDPGGAVGHLRAAAELPYPRHGGQWPSLIADLGHAIRAQDGPETEADLSHPPAPLTFVPAWGHDARITNAAAAGDLATVQRLADEVGRFGPAGSFPGLISQRGAALCASGAAAPEGLLRVAQTADEMGLYRFAAWWTVEAAEFAYRNDLSDQALHAARRSLALAEALTLPRTADRARKLLRALGVRSSIPHARAGQLTSRQLEIARLVAQGLTNAEVAQRLFISVRTVTTHLDNVYTTLGIGSRAQLATWLAHQAADT